MRYYICLVVGVIGFITIKGQTIIDGAVPEGSSFIMAINGKQLLEKMSIEDFQKLEMYGELERGMMRKSKNPVASFSLTDMGLKLKSTSYVFFDNSDSINFTGYLSQVENMDLFARFAENFLASKYNQNIEVLQGNGYTIMIDNDEAFAWNDQMALIMESDISYSYFYSNPDVYDKYGMQMESDDEWEIQKALERQWLEKKVERIFRDASTKSTTHDFKEKGDLVIWTSANRNIPEYSNVINVYKDNPEYEKFVQELDNYYSGNEATFALKLEKGKIAIESESKLNEKTYDFTKKMLGCSIEKDFAKYVKGDHLIGYYGVSVKMKNLMDATKELYFPLAETFPEYGQMTIDAVELIDLIFDDQAIFDVLTGDLLYAVTDVREFTSTYYTYDYDENFERIKIEHSHSEVMPEMVLLLKTKDEESVQRIFRILEKTAGLVKEEDYFVLEGSNDLPFPVYMGVTDGVVCLTNDKSLMGSLDKGVESPMGKVHRKMLRKNSQCMFFNPAVLMDRLPTDELLRSDKDRTSYQLVKDNVSGVFWRQGRKKKQVYTSRLEMDTPADKNALVFALELFNDFYKIQEGIK